MLKDPVVAADGHTYERASLLTWYSMGRTRSPVTNSYLENVAAEDLVSNLAVSGLATTHRERLGNELLCICHGVRDKRRYDKDGVAARLDGLLDSGADPNLKDESSNTPLHLLIDASDVRLANMLLHHDASSTSSNDAGLDCVGAAEAKLATIRPTLTSDEAEEWDAFVEELRRRADAERARAEARDRARAEANEEHRERQRALAENERSLARTGGQERGLGRLEEGIGYFPSLATLQFQGSIPGPSPSVADYENPERERLDRILRSIGFIMLLYLLLS